MTRNGLCVPGKKHADLLLVWCVTVEVRVHNKYKHISCILT